jgi:hypothetical protein
VPGPPLRLAPDAKERARLQRGRLRLATLAAARLDPDTEPRGALAAVRQWLHSWEVIDYLAAGMARQQHNLEWARHGEEGWRATFYPAGIAHSMTGSAASQTMPFDTIPGRGVRSAPTRAQRTVLTMVTRP